MMMYRSNPALLSLLPPGAGFRTTTGVHLHTGFKMWLRCDPSVVRGLWRRRQERTTCQETLAHSDSLRPPQTCAAMLLFSWKNHSQDASSIQSVSSRRSIFPGFFSLLPNSSRSPDSICAGHCYEWSEFAPLVLLGGQLQHETLVRRLLFVFEC